MATLSSRFVRAFRALENELDLQPLVQLCAERCTIKSPLSRNGSSGVERIRRFWRNYLDSFQEVRTEFTTTVDGQHASALEWISSATMPDGRPLEFSGATLLMSDNERITSMHLYFDPRPLELYRGRKSPTPIRSSLDNSKSA